MDLMDLHQSVEQVIQGLQLRGADLFIQIPAEHGAGIDHVVRDAGGGSIGHLGGDAVVLSVFTGQALVVNINLGLELHDVFAAGQLIADVLGQAGFHDFRELGLVDDQDVTQVAFFGTGGIDGVADYLGRDDVQFDVEPILDHLGEPAGLGAVVVGGIIVHIDDEGCFFLSHRADGYQAQEHGNCQQNRQEPFHC